MSKTIKTAISMPQDLHDAVRAYAGDGKFSTALCELLRKALFPDGETINQVPEDVMNPLNERIETLEHGFNDFRDQIVQEVKSMKLSLLTEKVRTSPKKKVKGVKYGYVVLEGEVLQNVLDKFDLMQAAGLSQEKISPIMGLKGNTIVSHIRAGRRKSLTQQAYDALMAWTP